MGNGYPVSAIAMSPEIIDRLKALSFRYFQSHQNDPLGCSIAREVIRLIQEEGLIERSKRIGTLFKNELKQLAKRHAIIKEVRGRGLMMALEFFDGQENMQGESIFEELLRRRIIITSRRGLNILRIDPPLITKEDDIYYFLDNLNQILLFYRF